MKCRKANELIPSRALGDLDVEEKRSLENHISGCPSCRAEADQASGVVAGLKSLPAIETAEGRRDRTVAAMAREHSDRVERILLEPRKRLGGWRVAAIAAAVLLAVLAGGGIVIRDRLDQSIDLRVAGVQGRVQVYHDGGWEPLLPGMKLSAGTRVVTRRDSVAFFDVHSKRMTGGRVVLNQRSSLSVGEGASLVLDRGEIHVSLPEGGLDILTVGNETVSLSPGKCVVGLRETMVLVLGSSVKKPARVEGADVVFENQPFAKVADRVGRIVGVTIRSALPEVGDRRVWFYGRSGRKETLLDDFRAAMRGQGIQVRPSKEGMVAHLISPVEKREMSRRLFARVHEGEASLNSDAGALRLREGEEGFLQPGGTLAKSRWDGRDPAWTRPGHYLNPAPDPVSIPAKLSFRMVGKDALGRPIVECNIHGSEIVTILEGRSAVVSIEDATLTGEGEFLVPVRIRFD